MFSHCWMLTTVNGTESMSVAAALLMQMVVHKGCPILLKNLQFRISWELYYIFLPQKKGGGGGRCVTLCDHQRQHMKKISPVLQLIGVATNEGQRITTPWTVFQSIAGPHKDNPSRWRRSVWPSRPESCASWVLPADQGSVLSPPHSRARPATSDH